jgi:hypothetical protein
MPAPSMGFGIDRSVRRVRNGGVDDIVVGERAAASSSRRGPMRRSRVDAVVAQRVCRRMPRLDDADARSAAWRRRSSCTS